MAMKINIAENGKTFRLESESEELFGKELHNTVKGEEISPDLAGWEFEITGASDSAGFPQVESVEGVALKKVLLKFSDKGMNKRPKHEGKRVRAKNRPKGLKLRKTVRGKVISSATAQLNLKVLKEGGKKLSEIFPDQNAKPVEAAPAPEEKPAEAAPVTETSKAEAQPVAETPAQ